jgi:hypothetical protein
MSGSLNDLLQGQSSGSVLGAIAHPNVANPLAALQAGQQAAQTTFDLRAKRGQQLWGQALQQATDANGNVDFPTAQRIAAGMGPDAAQAAASNLQNISEMRSQQTLNNANIYKNVGINAISLAKDPSDANVEAVFNNMIAAGAPAQSVNAERARVRAMSEPDRQNYAVQHGNAALEQLHQVVGQTQGVQLPQGVVGVTTTQPTATSPGSVAPSGGGGVGATLSPEQAVAQVHFNADQAYVKNHPGVALEQPINRPLVDVLREQGQGWALPPGAQITGGGGGGSAPGVVDSSGKPVGPTNQPRLNVPAAQPAASGAAPAAPAAPTLPTPPMPPAGATPSPVAATPAPVAPMARPDISTSPNLRGPGGAAIPPPAATPPAPSVNAPRDSMTPGPRASLQGGVPIASTNALAPNVGTPGPPSPLVPGDVSAIMAGMNQARGAPATGTRVAGDVALGPGSQEAGENKRAGELLTAHDTAAATYPQTVFPYTQALSLYGRGMTTAPGSDFLNQGKGWANGVARSFGITGPFDTTKEYDSLHKYLAQIVSGNPVAAGSDARLAEVLAGNANTSIHELAGADMIKAGVALQRMTVALDSAWHAMSPQAQAQYGGNYLNYLRDQAPGIDVRAFAQDLYNPEQKKTLHENLQNGTQQDRQNYLDTLALARNARMITPRGPAAMP